ncbi:MULTISPECIES: RNA polymerase sigma factor [unclassified Streptomyces]|uniref:RNA polymerase sigma factor n=1 Tax=unclassified Streptomyces TaxID=2593676 RepID=UPI003D72B6D7
MRRGRLAGQVPADDVELTSAVIRAQNGDEAAFATLYRRLQPALLGYLRCTVGEDAEEIAAAVWREIGRDLTRFRGDGPGFRGWTACVARRHARERSGRATAASRHPAGPGGTPHHAHCDDRSDGRAPSAAAARDLITALPPAQAEAVLLRHAVQLDEAATARVMRRPRAVVRLLERRGLRRLARASGPRAAVPEAAERLGEPS